MPRIGTKREPVVHYSSGFSHTAWKRGFVGFFSRIRGILTSLLVTLVGGGIFSWLTALRQPAAADDGGTIPYWAASALFFVIAAVAIIVVWTTVRRYRTRFLRSQQRAHMLTHKLRDEVVHFSTMTAEQNTLTSQNRVDMLRAASKEAADNIKQFFRCAAGNDRTILCSIRLADYMLDDTDQRHLVYKVIGRSEGFSPGRTYSSIPYKLGVPGFFLRHKNRQGVLVYHDIDTAESMGALYRTENDKQFPDDYRTFMVAPINGRDRRGGEQMIGLLYVFSCEDRFGIEHVDAIRAIADTLGIVFPEMMDMLCRRGCKEERAHG